MLTAQKNGMLFVVLEPGNIDLLTIGNHIAFTFKNGNTTTEVIIAYTPDMVWVADQLKKESASIMEILHDSLRRPEVHVRPYHKPEVIETRNDN